MKNLCLFFLCIFLSCSISAQKKLSAKEWQADLTFLQKTIHQDYSFLFKKVTAKDFDAAVAKLHSEIPTLESHQIITRMAALVASFRYGHTYLLLNDRSVNFQRIPINLYQFKEEVYIEGVHKDYEKSLGAKVLAVEGTPIKTAFEKIRPVVPAENEQYFRAYGLSNLLRPEVLHTQGITSELKQNITLTLEKEGTTFQQTFQAKTGINFSEMYGFTKNNEEWVSARNQEQIPLYLKYLDRIYFYEYLPEQKTVYVRHSQIQDDPQEAMPAFYERVFEFIEQNEVEKLVLDVRLNEGGNNYKNRALVKEVIRSEKINQVGKFMVIIGRRTFSACQNLINELDNYTNVIFVGEPSAENINFYGDARFINLPNSKIPVRLSFAWWQDKPQWENAEWTAPHLAVEMSFEEYRNNEDPVLEAALNFDAKDFIIDPMAHFTELYVTGKAAEIPTLTMKMLKDPRYAFFDFEGQFNTAAHQVMNLGDLQGAYGIFQMNTQFFPNSASAWSSLAAIHQKMGQKEQAIEYYKKAIMLDAEGAVGENAKRRLSQIE
ncbi:MAG: tetratricopeptide repeat protein [Bacteroidota bacterium]